MENRPASQSSNEKSAQKTAEQQKEEIAKPIDPHYQSALVNAWITVRLEEDKTLVALSSVGIGLLVTLLTSIGLLRFWHIVLYALAFLGFFISILSGLSILTKNANHIELILKQKPNESEKSSQSLQKLEKRAKYGFIFGLAMSIVIGLILGADKLNERMSEPSTPTKGAVANHERKRITEPRKSSGTN